MKQEWPHNWTTFVSDIVGASKTSESLCTNNMAILKLLRSTLPARLYVCCSFPLIETAVCLIHLASLNMPIVSRGSLNNLCPPAYVQYVCSLRVLDDSRFQSQQLLIAMSSFCTS